MTVTNIEVEGMAETLAEADTKDESDAMAVTNEETDVVVLGNGDDDIRLVRVMRGLEVTCVDVLPCSVDV